MWWILGIVLILLVWGLWLYFDIWLGQPGQPDTIPTWFPIVITALVLTLLIGLWAIRRIRAARAARALEKAIAQQAQEQALAAKPEDREEIRALNKQIQEGIAALKASKLADGRRGDEALYSLPWYAIVGPPGAGKTTALKHSGLIFPFLDSAGGGVRGVGGTRNCDWWFTNEAILLDTAGRYTTEEADHDEWVSFLEALNKYRVDKPLNGAIIAISVPDLLEANDDAIVTMASRVRARIDEMQETLKMTMPVYVLFTKVDLVAGFVEFFGDLKKSERGQPWGATYRLDAPITDHGKRFEEEFALLVQQLHLRGIRRMNVERSRATKEKIYQFPLEFAGIKRPLADFLQHAFAAGSGPTPKLRGFYFTSGTQEGKPLDRIVGAMGRAFGLKGAEEQESDAPKEGKSYFLHDVFTGVVFPDQNIAAVTDAELKRRRFKKVIVLAAACALAALVLVPALFSFFNNRALVADTDRISTAARTGIDWNKAPIASVEKLNDLRDQSAMLHAWTTNGPPLKYTWAMYQGDKLDDGLQKQYVAALNDGFMRPTKNLLEDKLKGATGDPYLPDYNNLKTYLLLNDKDKHLADPEYFDFAVRQLTQDWAEQLQSASGLTERELRDKLEPHVRYYVTLMRDKHLTQETEEGLIQSTRDKLRNVGLTKAYYEQYVMKLLDEKDPLDDSTPKYPAVSINTIFEDRREVLNTGGDTGVVASSLVLQAGNPSAKPYEVQGIFTAKAHDVIMKSLKDVAANIDREAWVVPFSREEKNKQEQIDKAISDVRKRYWNAYMDAWDGLFYDLRVREPQNNIEAIAEFRNLATPEWAYKRLLRTLKENTQFAPPKQTKTQQLLTGDGGIADQLKNKITQRVQGTNLDPALLAKDEQPTDEDPIPEKFRSMVEFAIPPPPPPADKAAGGEAPPPPAEPAKGPKLDAYIEGLTKLAGAMESVEEGPPDSSTKKATELFTAEVESAQADLESMDKHGHALMEALLLNPLRQGYQAAVKGAGGAASGLWEVQVWPTYREQIKNRYPFNLSANRDASMEDFKKFFAPKTGILWGFYNAHLKEFHRQQDHDFIPVSHLLGDPGSAGKAVARPIFNPLMYNCLKRADEISDSIWGMPGPGGDDEGTIPAAAAQGGAGGEAGPDVEFELNLKTVSPIVSDVIFEVDGQQRVYRNEKEFYYSFHWPGKSKFGARIQVRGAGGLDEEIVREGPWGIFRLFESADKMTAVKDDDSQFLVTWQMTAPPVTVTMQVRPKKANHPFPLSFFRNLNCPPSIGDKFGGKKH